MENAGRALAHLGRVRFFGGDPRGKRVTVLAGTGSNGGGAMACARRLQNWGARVGVLVTKPNEGFASVPAQQLRILRRMGVEVGSSETAVGGPGPDLIVDAHRLQLEGGAQGHGRRTHSLGRRPRRSRSCPGCPSGVDATTGTAFAPAVRAAATMTLALPKEGLRAPGVEARVGELYLADIGVPPPLYAGPALGLKVGRGCSPGRLCVRTPRPPPPSALRRLLWRPPLESPRPGLRSPSPPARPSRPRPCPYPSSGSPLPRRPRGPGAPR
jgi:NAD(P)H-hydrate epimerase